MYTKVSGKGINKSVLPPKKAEIVSFWGGGGITSLGSLGKNSKTYFKIATLDVNLTYPKGCYLVYRRSKSCVSLTPAVNTVPLSSPLAFPPSP